MVDPEKHLRYNTQYLPNDYFWGIGIENETYFQLEKPAITCPDFIYENHRPERYSVNYFVSLNPEYKDHLKLLYPQSTNVTTYPIPVFLNAHTLQKTDLSGNHVTLYTKSPPPPNPKFSGQTFHELLMESNPAIFKDKFKVNYTFDGDTIEFMTQKFYKTTIQAAISELIFEKTLFLQGFRDFFKIHNLYPLYGQPTYPSRNEGFVKYLTNMANISSFNNGTYHFNFTLPTQLGSDSKPVNPQLFVNQHKAAIRYIQYLEPLIIALYGTPDPFSEVSSKYSKASQRCAMSRYIGIGTYNTDTMETGKILTLDAEQLPQAKLDYWWYKIYHKDTNYLPLPKIGVDINFSKHGTHGLEIRFLDWFAENRLDRLMETCVYTFDYALANLDVANPICDPIWNSVVVKCLQGGRHTILSDEEYEMYRSVFNMPKIKCDNSVKQIYALIEHCIRQSNGLCAKLMLEIPRNVVTTL